MGSRSLALLSLYVAGGLAQQCPSRFQESQCNGECKWDPSVPACKRLCYLENVAYTGDMAGQPMTNEVSKEACKRRCFDTNSCEYFTFYSSTGNCHLHDASASRIGQQGAVAGPYEINECLENTPTSTVGATGSANPGSANPGSGPGPSPPASSFSVPVSSTVGSAVQAPFAQGNLAGGESMPQDVGSAMVVGSAQAGGSFSGLSAQTSLKLTPAVTQRWWQVGGLAAIALSFAAATACHRSIRRHNERESQAEALVADVSAE